MIHKNAAAAEVRIFSFAKEKIQREYHMSY